MALKFPSLSVVTVRRAVEIASSSKLGSTIKSLPILHSVTDMGRQVTGMGTLSISVTLPSSSVLLFPYCFQGTMAFLSAHTAARFDASNRFPS